MVKSWRDDYEYSGFDNGKNQEEIKVQELLDREYPLEVREKVKIIDISRKFPQGLCGLANYQIMKSWGGGLQGIAEIKNFPNLVKFSCKSNSITKISIANCPKLNKIYCSGNKISNLNITDCPNVSYLHCDGNKLTKIDFLNSLDPEKLIDLVISNNDLSKQDLLIFSKFTNLERLEIGYNYFFGSLEPLKNLVKLEELNICYTNVNSGLEYLSESLEKINCDSSLSEWGKARAAQKLSDILTSYQWDIEKWRETNLISIIKANPEYMKREKQRIKKLSVEEDPLKELRKQFSYSSLTPTDLLKDLLKKLHKKLVEIQKQDNHYENLLNLVKNEQILEINERLELTSLLEKILTNKKREINELQEQILLKENAIHAKKEWKNIRNDFTPDLQKKWEKLGFSYDECREWVCKCLSPYDAKFAYWLKIRGYTAEWFSDHSEVNRVIRRNYNWGDMHEDFSGRWGDEKKREGWEKRGFNKEECRGWINMGLKPTEYEFAAYLKGKKYNQKEIKDDLMKFEKKYEKWSLNPTAQEYFNFFYPLESREKIKRVGIGKDEKKGKLWGSLVIKDFPCVEKVKFTDNLLTSLILPNNPVTLRELNLSNNDFLSQNLSFLTSAKNLEKLYLGNNDIKKISQGIYNRFVGSLDYLSVMKELKVLDISNNDLDEVNLNKLPKKLEKIEYSTTERLHCRLTQIVPKLEEYEWKGLNSKFTLELRREWEKAGFYKEKTKQWISTGAKPDDYEFIIWLRDKKKEKPEWIQKYREDYESLKERFRKYGLCLECDQPSTGDQWCQSCNISRLKENFSNWTSGKIEVDQFIQEYQLEATDTDKFIEWIPYEQFSEVEYLAEGGFGKVYKAKWTEGNIHHWDIENKQWWREKDYYYENENEKKYEWNKKYKNYREVVLKSLSNSQENTDFLQETANHKTIDDWFNNIVPCYGISQDPKTGNYLIVMKYIEGGNLRQYLTGKKLKFADKLQRLTNIIQGLKDVHQKNLVHRDFHSGNILNSEIQSFITDLGLCKKADEINKKEEIYGVLPYVAPEVLRNKGYTLASDIYSLGIVAYEVFASASPYLDKNYDTLLALEICQGLRPNLEKLKIPQLLKNLIKRCWDADPAKRPATNELERTLRNWQNNTEFVNQLKKIEAEYNQISQNSIYKSHPTAIMTSKKIDTKQITKLLESSEKIIVDNSQEQMILESEEIAPIEIKEEQLQTQIQIPPK